MFIKITASDKKGENLIFRDKFDVQLDEYLFNKPDLANPIIDKIFNLDKVLVVKPHTCTSGYPPTRGWVTLSISTKPFTDIESAVKFSCMLKTIEGVRYASAIFEYPPTEKETIEHVYGGIRSKL